MVAAIGSLTNKPGQAGEMSGYPYSATGLPANFQIGVAAAADSNLPNAKAAWIIFQSRSVQPAAPNAYNIYPNFAVWQRGSPPSVPPRPVERMPPANATGRFCRQEKLFADGMDAAGTQSASMKRL